MQFGSAAISGTGAVTQGNVGTTIFNVSNTCSGATTINAGTLTVSNNGTTALGRLPNTSAIAINSSGTLFLSGSTGVTDRLNNLAPVTINGGGKLSTGSLSEGAAPTGANGAGGAVGVGALTLSMTSSALRASIDFGNTGNGSTLVFSSLAGSKGAFVSILNWTGTQNTDYGTAANDRLLFVADPLFSAADLANWQFSNDAGGFYATGGMQIVYNGYYEIVPVPEPATWAVGALMALALAASIRRRLRLKLPDAPCPQT